MYVVALVSQQLTLQLLVPVFRPPNHSAPHSSIIARLSYSTSDRSTHVCYLPC